MAYSWTNTGRRVAFAATAGATDSADRFRAWPLGVVLRYGYGINAIRDDEDEGAHSIGVLFQFDFDQYQPWRRARMVNATQRDGLMAKLITQHDSGVPAGAASSPDQRRDIWLTQGRIATTARVVFVVLALVAFAHLARAVVVPVLLAWVASMTLKAPVRWLRECHLPAPVAAAIVVGVFVAGIGYGVVHLGRPAAEWLAAAPENFPRLKDKFKHVLRPAARLSEAASGVGNLTADDTARKPQPVEVQDNRVANSVFTWTGSLLAGAGETIALLFLLLASGELFLQKLVKVMPRLRDKRQAVQISHEIQQSISRYLFSVGLINLGFGVTVGLALHLLGMPSALMWGGVAAFFNFIPYIGPILGMTAVGLAGLLAFDSLGRGLLPAGAYFLLHLIEANAVTPFLLGRRFALNPVLIFVALIFFTWLWGVIGALLAFPLLLTAKVVCDRVPALNVLGELLAPHDASGDGREAGATAGPPLAQIDPALSEPPSR